MILEFNHQSERVIFSVMLVLKTSPIFTVLYGIVQPCLHTRQFQEQKALEN